MNVWKSCNEQVWSPRAFHCKKSPFWCMHCALQHWTCMLCSNFVLCSTENDNNKSCKRQKARLSRTAESSFFFPRRDVGNLGPTDQQASLNQLDQQAGHQPDQPARKKNKGPAAGQFHLFWNCCETELAFFDAHPAARWFPAAWSRFFFPMFCVFFVWDFLLFFSCAYSALSSVFFFSTCASSARVLLQHVRFYSATLLQRGAACQQSWTCLCSVI